MKLFNKLGLLIFLLISFTACNEDNGGDPEPQPDPKPSIALKEIRYNQNDRFEISNLGTSTIDISDWWVCSRLTYAQLNTLTLEDGNLNLAPGASVILSGFSLDDDEADLGIFNTNSFTSSDAIIDFVQWGNSGQGRESVAAAAGIWTAGQFVPDVADGSSIEYDGTGDSPSDWAEQTTPTLGDTPTPAVIQVRLTMVDYTQEQVTIKNFGTGAVDISSYQLCLGPGQYNILSGYTSITGSLNLAAGDSLQIDLTSGTGNVTALPDASGALGLFANTNFTSTSADDIKDFMQWGAANQNRVDQAVTAGRWTNANDFVSGFAPYQFTGGATDIGSSFWQSTPTAFIRLVHFDTGVESVTIKNLGDASADISSYQLCLGPGAYNILSDYSTITGSLNLAAGDSVQIDLTSGSQNVTALPDANGALGLFANTNFGSTSADDIKDFVQWGAANQNRVDQAVTAGRWTSVNDFVSGFAPYQFTGGTVGIGSSFWQSTPTAFIRFVHFDTGVESVTIKNLGDASADISSYQLCLGPGAYNILSDYSTITGSLNLAAGDSVQIDLTSGSQNVTALPDANGALGLFANTNFNSNSADDIKDFVQWGAANQNRVSQAVAAGRWTNATDFVSVASPYNFTGGLRDIGSSFWD